MTYFKLDIPKINDDISRYKEIKKGYVEDMDLVYGSLSYLDSAWNDVNSPVFKEKIKRDRSNIIDYFCYLDNLYSEIQQFTNNIDYLCSKQGCRKDSITLKFDDSEINSCITTLKRSITLLDQSLNKININLFRPDFEYLSLIYKLQVEIRDISVSIKDLISEITVFVNSINNEINDSKVRVKRIGQFNMNLDLTEYVWKLSDLNVKINNKDDLETYGSVISKPINDFNKGNPNLNSPSVTYTNQVNSIKLNNDSKVDGLGSNINSSFSTLNDINLKDVKKVDDLGKNINSTFANNNKIDFDKQNKVSNLNDNIEFQTGRNNEIELNDIKRIGNLSSNIGFVSGNKTDINFKPSTAIGNTINTYQTNTNNINSDNIPKGNYDLGSGITVANSGYNGISNIKSNDMKDIINHE